MLIILVLSLLFLIISLVLFLSIKGDQTIQECNLSSKKNPDNNISYNKETFSIKLFGAITMISVPFPFGVLLGIFIIGRHNWARVLAIGWGILCSSLIMTYLIVIHSFTSQEQSTYLKVYIFFIPWVCLNALTIYLGTRQQIKEKFKQQTS